MVDAGKDRVRIFVSHSAKDVALAEALVECLEACLEVPDQTIRCTSVSGYKLEPGSDANEALRQNLAQCSVVIGLLTEESLQSGYVIMELGAAWGLGKITCPVLGPNVEFGRIPGPLAGTHTIKADNNNDFAGLIDVVAKSAGLKARSLTRMTAGVHAFGEAVKALPPTFTAARAASSSPMITNETDARIRIKSWLTTRPHAETIKEIRFQDLDRDLSLQNGMTKKLIQQIASEWLDLDHVGEEFILFRSRPLFVDHANYDRV